MEFIRFLPLLTLVYPSCSKGDGAGDGANEKVVSMIHVLTNLVKAQNEVNRAQGEIIEDLQQDVRDLRKSLEKRLRENDLKIEWALTDGTLAPKNTSGIMENLARQEKKIDDLLDLHRGAKNKTFKPGSCAEIDGGLASGVHLIYPNDKNPVLAKCENSSGGGWTVIQKRFDGSVDFFRGWEEYAEGFGDPAGEYWLGLQRIHALTQAQNMELYIGLTYFNGTSANAKYASFSVASEEDKFRLSVSGYSGTAGDWLDYHNGQSFSTKDQDNDSYNGDCSNRFHGAWWYKSCYFSHLNGLFTKILVYNDKYMHWWGSYIKSSVMMIRPSNFRPSI